MKAFALLITLLSSSAFADVISVMSYNVENLFDTKHDIGKEDYTYLPLSVKRASKKIRAYCRSINNFYYRKQCFELNWDENVLNKKLDNIAKVIKGYNRGYGPDVVFLQEVENEAVLRRLKRKTGHKFHLLVEGPDKRGIDTAILSDFPFQESVKYFDLDIKASNGKSVVTRGLLKATIKVKNRKITLLNAHFPSQAAPDDFRNQAAKKIREIVERLDERNVILAGDFNTNENDAPHGLNDWLLNYDFTPTFYDSFEMSPYTPGELDAPGTHYYDGKWSFLDRILVWSAYDLNVSKRRFRPYWSTFEVIAKPWMSQPVKRNSWYAGDKLTPKRFNPETGEGVSDHFPIVLKIQIN